MIVSKAMGNITKYTEYEDNFFKKITNDGRRIKHPIIPISPINTRYPDSTTVKNPTGAP